MRDVRFDEREPMSHTPSSYNFDESRHLLTAPHNTPTQQQTVLTELIDLRDTDDTETGQPAAISEEEQPISRHNFKRNKPSWMLEYERTGVLPPINHVDSRFIDVNTATMDFGALGCPPCSQKNGIPLSRFSLPIASLILMAITRVRCFLLIPSDEINILRSNVMYLKRHVTQLSDKDLRSWDYATSYMVQKNPFKDFFGRLAFAMATGEADDPDDILASYEYRDDASDTGSSD